MHPALAARRRQIAAVRRRVVAAALATFVLAWGVVAWDGSMGAETAATTTAQVEATPTPDVTSSSDDSSSLTTTQS
jgi:hypothetical protein